MPMYTKEWIKFNWGNLVWFKKLHMSRALSNAPVLLTKWQPGVTAFLYYVLLFSLHTRHGITIWVHLVWKDLSICWITTWNLIPSCLHVELPKTISILIDHHHWLYFFCSVSSNNLIHLKWCEAIISYTLTHQLNWHFQALLTVLSNTSWLTHSCCIKCYSRDHCGASNTLNQSKGSMLTTFLCTSP